ncbi:MAG: hypothetical protein CMK06_06770 [Ponticaulis sp.]|nr:hypothetical protein [Ponticaulis sp.]
MSEPEDWTEKRVVNAHYTSAKASFGAKLVLGLPGQLGVKTVEKAMGGLWVGGTAYLTDHSVEFHANGLNKLFHAKGSIPEVIVPLSAVTEVVFRFGVVTKIVDIVSEEGTLSVRGYDMKRFAAAIEAAVASSQTGTGGPGGT